RGEMVPCGSNKITYVATKSGISDTCSFTVSVDCDKETIYCKAKALNSSYMYIDRVQFAGIDTITGNNGGYHYFNTACGSVRSGQTYSLCVTPGYPGSTYKVYWKIWIDYNADGFFDPLTEEAVYGYGTTVMCANITMPAYLPSRLTRMRIIQSYTGYPPNPCHSPLYGEVEDYCISLNGGTVFGPEAGRSAISVTPSVLRVPADGVNHADKSPVNGLDERTHDGWSTPFDVDIFPNPTSSEVSIKALFGAIAELQIYNSQGKMVWQNGTHSVSPNLQLEVSNWSDGIYTVVLRSSDNQQIIRRFVVHR
ncbi:MAG TPA: GEVED domain-containing protein, partial [Saprospiraceae bacterium]|nr:GEVED domain-containing protein [Saprospiraceae bacterium]